MPDTAFEIVLTIRLEKPVSAKALAGDLAMHISPLLARGVTGGDLVAGRRH